MSKRMLNHEELLSHLDWLASELKHPCDLTIHTNKAKQDLRDIIYTAWVLALASKIEREKQDD